MEDTILPLQPRETDDIHLLDRVIKIDGDYTFFGEVRGLIKKKSGKLHYAVENDQGLIHIFSGSQLIVINGK